MGKFIQTMVGRAPGFLSTLRASRVVAGTDVTVLIRGETGAGKELLAGAIHEESRRASMPMVTINCAALPDTLAESELFGHRKGSFTGAVCDYAGRIQAAAGGTLFLDEIGELSLSIQAKLLRFIESGEIQAVGDTAYRRVDTRIVSATNRDLYREVKAGRFREDLYYRLSVVPLELPPLRERPGDVRLLLSEITDRAAMRHGLAAPRFSQAAVRRLEEHGWPGNVRELKNLCERLVVLFSGRVIEPENLPAELQPGANGTSLRRELLAVLDTGLSLDELEEQLIRHALFKTGGNRSRAARLLGLTRDTLLYRIKKHAIA